MEAQKGPLDDLKMTAQKALGDKPLKALAFFGHVLEAQRKVLEFELALIEDAQRFVRKFTAPPAA
jgi:hypothetical protein